MIHLYCVHLFIFVTGNRSPIKVEVIKMHKYLELLQVPILFTSFFDHKITASFLHTWFSLSNFD